MSVALHCGTAASAPGPKVLGPNPTTDACIGSFKRSFNASVERILVIPTSQPPSTTTYAYTEIPQRSARQQLYSRQRSRRILQLEGTSHIFPAR